MPTAAEAVKPPPVGRAAVVGLTNAPGVGLKNVWVAVALAFVWCGFGQLYNGETKKGAMLAAAYLVSFLLVTAVIGIFTTLGLWVWGMYDAYQTADRLNKQATSRS